MSGITSVWLLYEMAMATDTPSRALAILHMARLRGIGLVVFLAMFAPGK